MIAFQEGRIKHLSRSHHYPSYPELFAAVGYPRRVKHNLMAKAKRLRGGLRSLRDGI